MIDLYVELGSGSNGRPSVRTNRRIGDCEDGSADTAPHIFGQSSMGKGASNIDGGIIALNCSNAALLLNSAHPYSGMQWPQRFETNARFL